MICGIKTTDNVVFLTIFSVGAKEIAEHRQIRDTWDTGGRTSV